MKIIVDRLVSDFKPFRLLVDVLTPADQNLLDALLRVAASSADRTVSSFAKEIKDLLP